MIPGIVMDLLTPYRFNFNGRVVQRRIKGGLLGHWSVWMQKARQLLDECHTIVNAGGTIPAEMVARSTQVTDTNAVFFDAANAFAGCIAGLHEVLRRQGLLEGVWYRAYQAYPHLNDDAFVAAHRDRWLNG